MAWMCLSSCDKSEAVRVRKEWSGMNVLDERTRSKTKWATRDAVDVIFASEQVDRAKKERKKERKKESAGNGRLKALIVESHQSQPSGTRLICIRPLTSTRRGCLLLG